jgi:hypothetical protein
MDPAPPTPALLARLRDEEELLRAATAATAAAHAALRSGDMTALGGAHTEQESLAGRMQEAAAARQAAAEAVAAAVGVPAAGLTLAAIAARLPDPTELLAARARLAAAAGELEAIQRRHANLALHLRSYFRGVLSELTAGAVAGRYGPSGSVLGPAGGTLQTRG